jgi:hypothetical protein
MEFAAHGDIKIKWLGNILVVKPSGSVNLEGAEYFAQWVNKQITDKNFTHWGRITEFKDVDSLATPDAYQHLQSHFKEDIALGCVFLGLVGGNSLGILSCERAARESGLPVKQFTDFASAVDYMINNIHGIYVKD